MLVSILTILFLLYNKNADNLHLHVNPISIQVSVHIHFNHETDTNDRALALEAIRLLQKIIGKQFAAFGALPWFIETIPGEAYIKKEWESNPFVRAVFLPNCQLVGPKHSLTMKNNSWIVHDASDYDDTEINDEEFSRLRTGKNNE